jgi:hypothetical protein
MSHGRAWKHFILVVSVHRPLQNCDNASYFVSEPWSVVRNESILSVREKMNLGQYLYQGGKM